MRSEIPIDQIVIGARARKSVGHLGGLQASVETLGMLQPIVLNSRNELVAGFRRLQVAKLIGWETVPCVIAHNLDDALLALKAELHENAFRENMDPTDMVELGKKIEELEREKARERKGGRPRKDQETGGNFPPVSEGKTRDKVASSLGISGRTYEKLKQVAEAAEKEPERFGDLPTMMDQQSVDAAHKELQKRKGEQPRKSRKQPQDSTPCTQSLIPCDPCEPQPPAWKQTLDLALSQLCDTFDALPGPPDEIADALEEAANRLLTQAATLRSGR